MPARARFCPECGMATGATRIEMLEAGPDVALSASSRTVESTPPARRGLVLAVGGIVAVAAVLALSRSGDDEPTAAAATVPSTSTPAPAEPTTATTVPPAAAEPTPDVTIQAFPPPDEAVTSVDVSEVPAALSGTTVVVPGSPALAIQLGTGAVMELAGVELDAVERVIDTTERGVVVRDENGSGKLVDWSFTTSTGLGWNVWPGSVVVSDDNIWMVDGVGDDRQLVRIDEQGRRTTVRSVPEWVSLVGGSDGSAYVSSVASASVVRIGDDDRLTSVADGIGALGGEEWLLLLVCDDQLSCGVELLDLRTGRRLMTDVRPEGGVELVQRSADGRRALFREWNRPSSFVVVDADEMTAERFDLGFDTWQQTTANPELTHVVGPDVTDSRLTIVELASAEVSYVPLPRSVTSVIVTPEGWEPAVALTEGAASSR
ncbi:MAG: hypothetical protein AAFZ07_07670 [Actinomycetota bacterium]